MLPTEDHSGYRIWYRTYGPGPPSCYATSTDGIHWTKPALGIISYNGSTANNMYTTLGTVGSVVHTPFNTNPNRRYTFLAHAAGRFMGAWSGDGVHWSGLPNNPLNLGDSDVAHVAWDPLRGRYLAYVKLHGYLYGLQRRAVGFSTTTDFISWP
ncbi:MAG: hypothetical protein M5U12_17700, partial [Verrucomicrobia bacterium]|nr:hypothetical protein [Verrucomicrobiota bacterium]